MDKIRVNFSGHPVAGWEVAPLVGVNLPTGTGEELEGFVRQTLDGLPEVISARLALGEAAEIILPGLAPVAGVLLAEWHGRNGSFPTIRWSVRSASGFVWPEEAKANLDALRLAARTRR